MSCEDQAITDMPKKCTIWPCCTKDGGLVKNEKGFMVCPHCGASYGEGATMTQPKTNLQIATKAAKDILCTGNTSPNKNEPPGYKGRQTIAIISTAIDEATVVQTIEIKRLENGIKQFEKYTELSNDNCDGYSDDYKKGWNDASETFQEVIGKSQDKT